MSDVSPWDPMSMMEDGHCTVPGLGVTSPRASRRTHHSAVFAHMTDPSAPKSGFPPPSPPPPPAPPATPITPTEESVLQSTCVPTREAEAIRMDLETQPVPQAQPRPVVVNEQPTTHAPDFNCSCKQGRRKENLPGFAAERTTIRILHPPGGPSSERFW